MPMDLKLDVTGMTCNNCVQHVAKALNDVPGVVSVIVDLDAATASVAGEATSDALLAAVADAGYAATIG